MKEYKINEIVSFQNGYPFESADMSNNGINIIKIKEMKKNKILFTKETQKYNLEITDKIKKVIITKNDILVALTGDPQNKGNIGSWVGRTSIYSYEFDSLLNQRICKIIPEEKIVNQKYLYYWLSHPLRTTYLAGIAKGSANQANISHNEIGSLKIRLPLIQEQEKIANILSTIDDKIECNNKIIDKMNALNIHLMNVISCSDMNEMTTKKIKELGKVITGKTPPTNIEKYYGRKYPFITIPDIHNNIFVIDSQRYLSDMGKDYQSNKLLPIGTLIISCIATIGLVSITTKPSFTNQQINAVIVNDERYKYYIFLKLKKLKVQLEGIGSGGAVVKNINKNNFEEIEIDIPNSNTINKYYKKLDLNFSMILKIQSESKRLEDLKKLYLKKFFI